MARVTRVARLLYFAPACGAAVAVPPALLTPPVVAALADAWAALVASGGGGGGSGSGSGRSRAKCRRRVM